MADRRELTSPAYLVLRPSARRLLAFIGTEIERQGGGTVTIYNDQLEVVGSRRVYLPGLHELSALGLIELVRLPKRHLIGQSDRWREITTRQQARAISAAAREQRKPPLVMEATTAAEQRAGSATKPVMVLPSGFIPPCLPSKATKPPTGRIVGSRDQARWLPADGAPGWLAGPLLHQERS